MPLPDLTWLLDLCETEARCRGLIAFGPAVRDYAPPGSELSLLLLGADAELQGAVGPLQDLLVPPVAGELPIRLLSWGVQPFGLSAKDPWETAWFLQLSESVVLYAADADILALWEDARAWTPARVARARLLRTGELIRMIDAADRAMEAGEWEAAAQSLVAGLVAHRWLDFLRAGLHPGSSFWGIELGADDIGAVFRSLEGEPLTPAVLEGLAETLVIGLEVALGESFGSFEQLLAGYPAGVAVETLHREPLLEDLPHWDLVLWRHHRRGAVEIRAERRELPDLPGHWTTSLIVQLAAPTSPGDAESS